MKLLLSVFVWLIFSSCNNSNKQERVITNDSVAIGSESMDKEYLVSANKIAGTDIPSSIKFKGNLYEAWRWKDKSGDNILITSTVAPFDDKQKNEYGEEGQTTELHAFQFVQKNNEWKLLWKMSDSEKACPFDITAEFLKNAITVTDLDSNGIAETTIQYKLACRSDVSPSIMKLIMHEDTIKYSLRGMMWIKVAEYDKFNLKEEDLDLEKQAKSDDEYESYLRTVGRYQTEKEFSNAPLSFLNYAKKQWYKNVIETFE